MSYKLCGRKYLWLTDSTNPSTCRSQWLHGLTCGSAAAHMLGLWVWIPPGAWMSVCCQVEVSVSCWSLVQRSPTNGGVSNCVRSQWLRGLTCGSAATHMLGLWVWIPPGAWMFVCCQVEVSVSCWSLVQRSTTNGSVSNCVRSWILDNEKTLAHDDCCAMVQKNP